MKRSAVFCAGILCASILIAFKPASALFDAAPVEIGDIAGKWRSESDKKKIFTITREGNTFTLETPKYKDWQPIHITPDMKVSNLHFERKTTEDDIRNMKLDNAQDPPSEGVIRAAAGVVGEDFRGAITRTYHYTPGSKDCELIMNVRWVGFHIKYEKDSTGAYEHDGSPEQKEKFKQILYAWPDLRKSVVNTSFNGAANTGTEISSYFSEHAAMKIYGEFGAALFKPIFKAVTGVVPAETFLGKLAEKLVGSLVPKALTGDVHLKDLTTTIAGQVLDKALEGVADREPFATIKAKLDKGLGSDQVDTIGGVLKDEAAKKAGEKLTPDEVSTLDDYLKKQCRYELVKLDGYGLISGGIAVVDKQLGTARVWLFLTPRGTSEPIAVTGTTSVPEEGQKAATLNIHFSQVGG